MTKGRPYNRCPVCDTTAVDFYALRAPIQTHAGAEAPAELREPRMRCECRRCGHVWVQEGATIIEPEKG